MMYELRLFTRAIDDRAALVLSFNADSDDEALTTIGVFDRQQLLYERAALYAVEGKTQRRFITSASTRERD